MTKNECIETDNYDFAIEKYETSTKKSYWWDCIVKIYEKCADFAKKYIIDPIARTIKAVVTKTKKARRSKYDEVVINLTDYSIKDNETKNIEKCYLFKFLDSNNELIYSKVGTASSQTIWTRLTQEIRDYRKNGYDIQKVEVNRVWNCGDLPAEGLESLIRSEYIKQFPKAFKKNDRFISTLFDLDLCDKIAKNYLEMA